MNKRPRRPEIFEPDFLKAFESSPSYSYFPEFIAVAAGLKPVLRTSAVASKKFPALKKTLGKYGLFCESSDFGLGSADGLTLSPQGGSVYAYISKSRELAREAKRIEEDIRAKNAGFHEKSLRFSRLMGYPDCCFYFYERANRLALKACSRRQDIEYRARQNTSGRFSFYLNNLSRWDGYLVPHFPCSYNCRPSIDYARNVLLVMEDFAPEPALKLAALLKFPVIKFFQPGRYARFIGGRLTSAGTIVYRASIGEGGIGGRFSQGNKVTVGKKEIKIFKDDILIDAYQKENDLDGVIFSFQ